MDLISGVLLAQGGGAGQALKRMLSGSRAARGGDVTFWASKGVAMAVGHVGSSGELATIVQGSDGSRAVAGGNPVDWPRQPGVGRVEDASLGEGKPRVALAIAALNMVGDNYWTEVNGAFAVAVWDAGRNALKLIVDRWAMMPMYYCILPEKRGMLFASELSVILESSLIPRHIDWPGCSALMTFGHHVGDATYLRAVKRMRPATVIECDYEGVEQKLYWDMAAVNVDTGMSLRTAVDGCTDLFEQSIARIIASARNPISLPLSGGADSGRIAVALAKQGEACETWTTHGFGHDSHDMVRAKALSDRLGFVNHPIDLPQRGFLQKYVPKTAKACDYETPLHQWALHMVDHMPPTHRSILDGIWGDIGFNGVRKESPFWGDGAWSACERASDDELASLLIPKIHEFRGLPASIQAHLAYDDVLDRVVAELQRYNGSPNRVTLWYLHNRTNRAISLLASRIFSLKAEVYSPFLDNDLAEFLLTVPMHLKLDGGLRQTVLRERFPELTFSVGPKHDAVGKTRANRTVGTQRMRYHVEKIHRYFLCGSDSLHSSKAVGKTTLDLIRMLVNPRHVSYLLCSSFALFYEWARRYPHILQEGGRPYPRDSRCKASARKEGGRA